MRVLLAPDCFGGTLSAAAAARALAAGWACAAPADTLDLVGLSDGGPGFLDVLAAALASPAPPAPPASPAPPAAGPPTAPRGTGGGPAGAELVATAARDPLGRPVLARVLRAGAQAYVESAEAVGLHLLATGERDPERASSAGLAPLLLKAAELVADQAPPAGRGHLVVGLGGSATCDGGAGLLEALGERGRRVLEAVPLVGAVDVDIGLLGPQGATHTFAGQKGADQAARERLERRMAAHAGRLDPRGRLAPVPGAGAAGGLGFALLCLGARLRPGFDVVAGAVGLAARLARADLVVTGEGRLDATSFRGKVVGRVAAAAAAAGVPCLVVAGSVAIDQREARARGVAACWALADLAGSDRAAHAEAARWLAAAAEAAARHPPARQHRPAR